VIGTLTMVRFSWRILTKSASPTKDSRWDAKIFTVVSGPRSSCSRCTRMPSDGHVRFVPASIGGRQTPWPAFPVDMT